MPKNDEPVEEFLNQSSLCATCAFGVRQVATDFDEVPPQKRLYFLCHNPAVRGAGNPRPASMVDLVSECEVYCCRNVLVNP